MSNYIYIHMQVNSNVLFPFPCSHDAPRSKALDGGSEYKSMVASFAQCGLAEVPLTSTLRANEADISRD